MTRDPTQLSRNVNVAPPSEREHGSLGPSPLRAVFGEALTAFQIAGMGVAAAGVALASRG